MLGGRGIRATGAVLGSTGISTGSGGTPPSGSGIGTWVIGTTFVIQ